jgi:hypothetical protein
MAANPILQNAGRDQNHTATLLGFTSSILLIREDARLKFSLYLGSIIKVISPAAIKAFIEAESLCVIEIDIIVDI